MISMITAEMSNNDDLVENQDCAKEDSSETIQENPKKQDTSDLVKEHGDWFIVHVPSLKEQALKRELLQKEFKNIFEVYLPLRKSVKWQRNKKVEKFLCIFSRYLFIRSKSSEDINHAFAHLRFDSKINIKIQPTTTTSIEELKKSCESQAEHKNEYKIDDRVIIRAGSYNSLKGTITKIVDHHLHLSLSMINIKMEVKVKKDEVEIIS